MSKTEELELSNLDISTLTDDPDALAQQILGEAPKGEAAEKPEDEKPEAEAETPEKAEKPEGPGDVRKALQDARARLRKEEAARKDRERELDELKQAKTELEAKIKAGGDKPDAATEAKTTAEEPNDLDEVIKAVEEDAPDLAKALRVQADRDRAQSAEINSLKETIAKLNEQISGVVKRDRDAEEEAKAAAQAEVDKAIEATPKLAYLRDMADSNPTLSAMWEAAITEDQTLRSRGKWVKATFADRFAEVVTRIERDFGEIKLPAEYLNKAEIEARAVKAGEKAKGTRPSTLSDLPGGTPPAPDALGSLEGADPASLLSAILGAGDADKAIEDMLRKAG